MNSEEDQLSAREQKLHYESLISLAKWIVGIIGVIFTVGGGIVGCNVYQINRNLEAEVKESRERVASISEEALKVITNLERATDIKISDVEKQIRSEILLTVRTNVQEELSTPRLQQLIYSELRTNVKNNLDDLAEESFATAAEEIDRYITDVGDLNLMYQEFFTFNTVLSIKYMDSIRYNSNDRRLRQAAQTLIIRSIGEKVKHMGFKSEERYLNQLVAFFPEYKDLTDKQILSRLKKKISSVDDIGSITKYFQVLEDITDGKIKMYEFSKLKKM